jgi:hypothetical protein
MNPVHIISSCFSKIHFNIIHPPTYLKYIFSGSTVNGYELKGRGTGVRFAAGARDFSLLHSLQTGSETHAASCTMDTGRSLPGGKLARV